MNIVLLAGGSGKLLWPLSNGVRSKQFIRIFRTPDGERESMLQRVCRQVRQADPSAAVTIATSKSQVSAVRHQLGDHVNLCVEPCRRDTFPAIALAAAYLHDVQGIGLDRWTRMYRMIMLRRFRGSGNWLERTRPIWC